jgi:hypothetical protein
LFPTVNFSEFLVIKTLDPKLDPDPHPQLEKMPDLPPDPQLNQCESATMLLG